MKPRHEAGVSSYVSGVGTELSFNYLADFLDAAASSSCALIIAFFAAALAQSSSLGAALGYCRVISLHAAMAALLMRFSSSAALAAASSMLRLTAIARAFGTAIYRYWPI
jgi:hypothetical protein